jgi:hypothetical protein
MPTDKKGNFHQSSSRARSADAMEPKPKGDEAAGENPEAGEQTHTVTDHGDGTFHSKMHDGTETDHPDHLHMLAHVGHHIAGGKHHVAHHDGMGIRSHGVSDTGEHSDTQDHNSAEDAKEALGQFFNEEAQEPEHQHAAPVAAPVGGGY